MCGGGCEGVRVMCGGVSGVPPQLAEGAGGAQVEGGGYDQQWDDGEDEWDENEGEGE